MMLEEILNIMIVVVWDSEVEIQPLKLNVILFIVFHMIILYFKLIYGVRCETDPTDTVRSLAFCSLRLGRLPRDYIPDKKKQCNIRPD